jgi:hypothetical protein
MGCEKLGAVRCVEAGATEHQLMALFGWSTTKQAAVYTRKANRVRLEASTAPLLASVPRATILNAKATKVSHSRHQSLPVGQSAAKRGEIINPICGVVEAGSGV